MADLLTSSLILLPIAGFFFFRYVFLVGKRTAEAAQRRKGWDFVRWDNEPISCDCVRCITCKNYFWVQHVEVESPSHCCYCGTKFGFCRSISNEEMNEQQSL